MMSLYLVLFIYLSVAYSIDQAYSEDRTWGIKKLSTKREDQLHVDAISSNR